MVKDLYWAAAWGFEITIRSITAMYPIGVAFFPRIRREPQAPPADAALKIKTANCPV